MLFCKTDENWQLDSHTLIDNYVTIAVAGADDAV